jgi:hypothetical protein
LARFVDTQKREARYVVTELVAVRGLMPLLMKSRNGDNWSPEEKAELIAQLRRLSRLSPYLLFLLVPGSALLLPIYAWWLDRRRDTRQKEGQTPSLPDSQRP